MTELLNQFCIKHNYFTGGTPSQYRKFFLLAGCGATAHELALIIFMCSDNADIEQIKEQLTSTILSIQ
ncbi:MAG: hypothetical protein JEZ08_22460 [Clostridiales bacterium]|nr:hypothetical protein [Clostridiales bacterium]